MTTGKKVKIGTEAERVNETTEADQAVSLEQTQTGPGAETAPEEPTLAEQLEKAREEARDNYERILRVSAEFDNFKKRSVRDMGEFRKFATESLIKDLLPIVDNLERAIQSFESSETVGKQFLEGVEMTRNEILRVFEKFGARPLESVGQLFDPRYHQAVMQQETAAHPENTVVQELHCGYTLHDRLLRPAMVVVSKAPSGAGDGSGA